MATHLRLRGVWWLDQSGFGRIDIVVALFVPSDREIVGTTILIHDSDKILYKSPLDASVKQESITEGLYTQRIRNIVSPPTYLTVCCETQKERFLLKQVRNLSGKLLKLSSPVDIWNNSVGEIIDQIEGMIHSL